MTQARFKVKKGDFVEVTTGKHKGLRGKVTKVLLDDAKVLVENVNMVVRHVRPTPAAPEGKVTKHLPLHISNVAIVDPSTDKCAKVMVKINEDGQKVRVFKKSGTQV